MKIYKYNYIKIVIIIFAVLAFTFLLYLTITPSIDCTDRSCLILFKFHQDNNLNGRLYLKSIDNLNFKNYESEEMSSVYKFLPGTHNVQCYFIDHNKESIDKNIKFKGTEIIDEIKVLNSGKTEKIINYNFQNNKFYELSVEYAKNSIIFSIKEYYPPSKLQSYIDSVYDIIFWAFVVILSLITGQNPF